MAMDMNADLLNMLAPNEFGVHSATISGNYVRGIFDRAYFEISNGEGGVESTSPAFICRTIDVPHIKHGDVVIIEESSFIVVSPQQDGTGLTEIMLEAA